MMPTGSLLDRGWVFAEPDKFGMVTLLQLTAKIALAGCGLGGCSWLGWGLVAEACPAEEGPADEHGGAAEGGDGAEGFYACEGHCVEAAAEEEDAEVEG